jgi:hypothetical protein
MLIIILLISLENLDETITTIQKKSPIIKACYTLFLKRSELPFMCGPLQSLFTIFLILLNPSYHNIFNKTGGS